MTDVCYVHTHFIKSLAAIPTILQYLYADGIVKVLGIVRVYGEGKYIAHIASAVYLGLGNVLGYAVGNGLYVLGVGVGQAEFRQYGMHFGVVLARASQYVHHLADRVLGTFRPFYYTDNGLVTVIALLQVILGNEYVVGQSAVLGEQVGIVFAYLQSAHKLLFRSLHYFYYLCFADMIAATCQHGSLHLVSVHGMHGIAFCHQNGFAAIVGYKGILAVGFAAEYSFHYLRRGIQCIAVACCLLDIIVQKQVFEAIHTKHLQGMCFQLQVPEQTF